MEYAYWYFFVEQVAGGKTRAAYTAAGQWPPGENSLYEPSEDQTADVRSFREPAC